MNTDTRPLMVTIRCFAYNQKTYIRECLDGFVMQKTNFRFEAIVHDDASTDGTTDIIREYAEKYPNIIKPVYETENQYSKHDGSFVRIMDEHMHGKYIAVCEGDDYWIDPLKLQKQFDFMEAHPECSLCFHADHKLLPSGEKVLHKPYKLKRFYTPEDVILGGGGFMVTNAMFYRWEYIRTEGRPDFWKNCPIGDLPSMLFLVSKGLFGYIDEAMSVYRVAAIGSWTSKQSSFLIRFKHQKAILRMFDEYDEYSGHKYQATIKKKKRKNICKFLRNELKQLIANLIRK